MDQLWHIIADGLAWEDADELDAWSDFEVGALAEQVERRGYTVELVPA